MASSNQRAKSKSNSRNNCQVGETHIPQTTSSKKPKKTHQPPPSIVTISLDDILTVEEPYSTNQNISRVDEITITKCWSQSEFDINEKALTLLQQKAKSSNQVTKIFTLLIDEVSIKNSVDLDVDVKSAALVFMVRSITDKWSVPIGYQLTLGDESTVSNWILDILLKLHKIGVKIIAVTTNAIVPYLGVSLGKKLGVGLDNINTDANMTTCFPHPVDGTPVNIVYDIRILIDTINATWTSDNIQELHDGYGRKIHSKYAIEVKNIKCEDLKYFGDDTYYDWIIIQKRMDYDPRPLSRVTADAIKYLTNITHPKFTKTKGTRTFIYVLDFIYNFSKIKDICGVGIEEPLRASNEILWKRQLFECWDYLKRLKASNEHLSNNHPLQKAASCLLITISSIIQIYSNTVRLGRQLDYLLPNRFTLDIFEMFKRFRNPSGQEESVTKPTLNQLKHLIKLIIDNVANPQETPMKN